MHFSPLRSNSLHGGSLRRVTISTINNIFPQLKFTIMSQFWFDTYVNMIGSTALNYYNVEAIDKSLTSNDKENSI